MQAILAEVQNLKADWWNELQNPTIFVNSFFNQTSSLTICSQCAEQKKTRTL
jgi:hypothetical protein